MTTDASSQSYGSHRRFMAAYHGWLWGLLLLTFIGSCVNLYQSFGDHQRLYSASLICILTLCTILLSFLSRFFALKAQDRAIRAEEQLRHYVLTGKLLDPRLAVRQIVGLRFASDEEFVALARRAADEQLSEDAIKREIKSWRADHYRV